uniref:Death domain-containing protein n=2 Tax=Iconisemion striatum TaxID=60296 RepID=A0A1A7X1S2_9TELE
MSEDPAAVIRLLRRQKPKLIEILSADADFVLQHADARDLLSPHSYQQVKHCRTPSEKVTDLLDHILQRSPESAQGLLDLLKEPDLQNTFPMLDFVKDLDAHTHSSEKHITSTKRKEVAKELDVIPAKKTCSNGSRLVTEKQLMSVARAIGRSWREIGRRVLTISSVKLEQIEEDHSLHVERVFAMLRYWRKLQRDKATAAHLHALLSQGDEALLPEDIDFLINTD